MILYNLTKLILTYFNSLQPAIKVNTDYNNSQLSYTISCTVFQVTTYFLHWFVYKKLKVKYLICSLHLFCIMYCGKCCWTFSFWEGFKSIPQSNGVLNRGLVQEIFWLFVTNRKHIQEEVLKNWNTGERHLHKLNT